MCVAVDSSIKEVNFCFDKMLFQIVYGKMRNAYNDKIIGIYYKYN